MVTIYSDSFPLDPSKMAVDGGRLNRSAVISRRTQVLPLTHVLAPSGSFAWLLMRFWGLPPTKLSPAPSFVVERESDETGDRDGLRQNDMLLTAAASPEQRGPVCVQIPGHGCRPRFRIDSRKNASFEPRDGSRSF